MKATQYTLHGCSQEINTCFKDAHALAPRCVAKDMKFFKENEPQKFECVTKTAIEDLKSWFGISYKWHSGLRLCLAGAEASEDFENPQEVRLRIW